MARSMYIFSWRTALGRLRSTRCWFMKLSRLALCVVALCALKVAANPRLTIRDATSGSAIAGASVVFAEEGRIGPYPSVISDADGVCELRPDVRDLLVIHPSYLPRSIHLTDSTSVVALDAGEVVKGAESVRSAGVSLRIYLASWIGHYDVERLPLLPSAVELRCGGGGVVFGILSRGHPRAVARGTIPALGPGRPVTGMNIQVRGPAPRQGW